MSALVILSPPPFATVQDLGRPGFRAQGVPPAGAMDPDALALANALVGNPPDAAGIEWALGPGRLTVDAGCLLAAGGSGPLLRLNGAEMPGWSSFPVAPGDTIELQVPARERFGYLAVGGGIAVSPVLGSRSTYLVGGFGGWEGRLLRAGDRLPVGPRSGRAGGELPEALRPERAGPIRIVDGPQADLFGEEAWDALLPGAYAISSASDRMGLRLDGPALSHRAAAALPSEPACPGAIQVPGGGAPIVLMPDGPTVGGYPKLAVVISADLGRLAQLPPGERPGFRRVGLEEAVEARTARARRWDLARRAVSG